ncbi:transposable element Tcb2 transposase [Trichonephila clavipes]|nr:transposable element Tcb2 transposase [Trichonephila clavipes]
MSSCRSLRGERIIGMMEAGWSARRVTCQLGLSDCVVRRCWYQWIREMSFTRRPSSRHPRQTTRLEYHHIVRNTSVQLTASSAAIQAQVAPSLGASVSSRIIRRRLVEGHLGSQRPLRVLALTPTHRCLRLKWCYVRGNWTAVEWNQVVFSYETRFNLSSDDKRVRVRGKRPNPAFALRRHTTPTAGAIFQQDNARPHTARVSQDCLRTVTTLPLPARFPDLSPIEHIWDH